MSCCFAGGSLGNASMSPAACSTLGNKRSRMLTLIELPIMCPKEPSGMMPFHTRRLGRIPCRMHISVMPSVLAKFVQ